MTTIKSANEFECGISGFISYIYILHVFRLYRRHLETNNGESSLFSGFNREDCFDRVVILFSSKFCLFECPIEVNCQ